MSNEQEIQETPRAAAAFLEYCALGPARSLRKLAEKLQQNRNKTATVFRQLGEWSSLYNWQERVKQYDAERIAERVAKKQEAREQMEDRHAEEAKEEQRIARAHIKAAMDKDGNAVGRISLAAVQLLKNSRDDERKALIEEEMPKIEQVGQLIGIAIYLPQKHALKGADNNGDRES